MHGPVGHRSLLWLALLVSLAFNAGVGATFGVRGYQRYRADAPCDRPSRPGSFLDKLDLTSEQQEKVRAVRDRLWTQVRELRGSCRQEHEALAELIGADETDADALELRMEKVGACRAEIQRLIVQHFLDVKDLLDEHQLIEFNANVQKLFSGAGFGRMGRGGHHGPPHGKRGRRPRQLRRSLPNDRGD